jgi:hypothetical protein
VRERHKGRIEAKRNKYKKVKGGNLRRKKTGRDRE